MFPGNYCSDGIVSLFAISRILTGSISVQRPKKLIFNNREIFGGAVFRGIFWSESWKENSI